MANTPTRYSKAALTTTSATLYTIPTGTVGIVTEIVLSNTTAADINATVSIGGTVMVPASTVPGNGMLTLGLKQVMSAAETITGFASATGVNVFISGVNVA